MAAGGGGSAQQSLRKAIGALKDSTTVGLAKVNSEYKALDIAIVKATYHDEFLAKEKHIRTILESLSASRPRADVAYSIHSLFRRLNRTRNWAVALKCLIIIHRALREADPTIREELMKYTQGHGHMLNLSHFKDESSHNAWDCSAWVRNYALYLEERLECLRTLKYDVQSDSKKPKLEIPDLLEHLPPLQVLLLRLICCQCSIILGNLNLVPVLQPEGAARHNYLIQFALSIVAAECIRIYVVITDGVLILVDKFFEMLRNDAMKTLEIYRKATDQAGKLSKFFETCNVLQFGHGHKFVKIEKPPESFITSMEEYVKEAPQTLMLPWKANDEQVTANPKDISAPESDVENDHKDVKVEENCEASLISLEGQEEDTKMAVAKPQFVDLLGLDDLTQEPAQSDDQSSLALVIATPENLASSSSSSTTAFQPTSWELALVTTPSSNDAAIVQSKLAGGLDLFKLDSLYNNAMATTNESSYGNAFATTNQSPYGNTLATSQSPYGNTLATMNQDPFGNILPTTNHNLFDNTLPGMNQNIGGTALPAANQNHLHGSALPTMNQNLYGNALPTMSQTPNNNAVATTNPNMGSYQPGEVGSNPFDIKNPTQEPSFTSSNIASPHNLQMSLMQQHQQQNAFLLEDHPLKPPVQKEDGFLLEYQPPQQQRKEEGFLLEYQPPPQQRKEEAFLLEQQQQQPLPQQHDAFFSESQQAQQPQPPQPPPQQQEAFLWEYQQPPQQQHTFLLGYQQPPPPKQQQAFFSEYQQPQLPAPPQQGQDSFFSEYQQQPHQHQQQQAFLSGYQQQPQQGIGFNPTNPFLEQGNGQGVSPYYPAQSQNPFSW